MNYTEEDELEELQDDTLAILQAFLAEKEQAEEEEALKLAGDGPDTVKPTFKAFKENWVSNIIQTFVNVNNMD